MTPQAQAAAQYMALHRWLRDGVAWEQAAAAIDREFAALMTDHKHWTTGTRYTIRLAQEVLALRAYAEECATDRDDRIAPGLKAKGYQLLKDLAAASAPPAAAKHRPVCHCGDYCDMHGPGDGHSPVEMEEQDGP